MTWAYNARQDDAKLGDYVSTIAARRARRVLIPDSDATVGATINSQPRNTPAVSTRSSGTIRSTAAASPLSAGARYVFGQASYVISQNQYFPYSFAMGDFNGDGLVDAAVTSIADKTITVLLGKPDGSMSISNVISFTESIWTVAAGDFNGDGRQDLAVTVSSSSNILILLSNGDGTFRPPVAFATSYDPYTVTVADLNHDGKLDLVVLNECTPNVSILLGNGDGSFQPHVDYNAIYGVGCGTLGDGPIAVGDLNGDGKPDLALATSSGVSLLFGKGNGTFDPYISYDAGNSAEAVAIGDMNGDHIPDLVLTRAVNGISGVSVILGVGDGTFATAFDYPVTPMGAERLVLADVNGDGKLDVLTELGWGVSPQPLDYFSVYLGNGDGTLQPPVDYGTGVSPFVGVADFNRDGIPDVAFTAYTCAQYSLCSAQLNVVLGKGDGTFEGAIYPAHNLPQAVATADFNGDGKLDVAVANIHNSGIQDNYTLSILLNRGDGTFSPSTNYLAGSGSVAVVTGDFNHDGKQDVALANQAEKTVSIFLGNGDGTLRAPVSYPVTDTPTRLIVGDFNGDGNLDLIAHWYVGTSVTVLLGNGDGTFRNNGDYAIGSTLSPTDVQAGDFNGDGRLDLVAVTQIFNGQYWTQALAVLLERGDGSFQSPMLTSTQINACSLAVGDFNGDGKADLAAVACDRSITSEYDILLGNGDGTFQAPVRHLDSGIGSYGVVVADFNGDGILDLAGAGLVSYPNAGGSASIAFGNGDGTFQHHVDYRANLGFLSLTAADLQGAGVLDLVGAAILQDGVTGAVAVLRNRPQVAFSPNPCTFYQQLLGNSSPSVACSVRNVGVAPLHLYGSPSLINPYDFSGGLQCPSVLNAGGTCGAIGVFHPTATGTRVGGFLIKDDAPNSQQSLVFAGLGYAIELSPAGGTFGSVALGQSASRQITITNLGGTNVALNSITIGGPDRADFSQTNTCLGTVSAHKSCTMTLTFKPKKVGTKLAAVTIYDTDALSVRSLPLRGTGQMH